MLQIAQPGLAGLVDGSVSTLAAYFVVGCELILIAFVRYRFFASAFWVSAVEVIVGGCAFAVAVLIGNS